LSLSRVFRRSAPAKPSEEVASERSSLGLSRLRLKDGFEPLQIVAVRSAHRGR
jgi:hypothetical protein